VGHDPEHPYINDEPTPRMVALHQERTAAFETLLREHFHQVTVVHVADYEVVMSEAADVTLFDASPGGLEGPGGIGDLPYRLPPGFSRPALMIAENAHEIGAPLGLKLGWL